MVLLRAVEPTTSRNSTDTWRRRGGAVRCAGLLLGEQRCERGIDDRAAEHRALRLERRDGLAQGVVRQLGLGHQAIV